MGGDRAAGRGEDDRGRSGRRFGGGYRHGGGGLVRMDVHCGHAEHILYWGVGAGRSGGGARASRQSQEALGGLQLGTVASEQHSDGARHNMERRAARGGRDDRSDNFKFVCTQQCVPIYIFAEL